MFVFPTVKVRETSAIRCAVHNIETRFWRPSLTKRLLAPAEGVWRNKAADFFDREQQISLLVGNRCIVREITRDITFGNLPPSVLSFNLFSSALTSSGKDRRWASQ